MSRFDTNRPDVLAFVAKAAQEIGLPAPPTIKDVFNFGDGNPRVDDSLLGLALSGAKTATTSWPVPDPMHWDVGDYSVILDGRGDPAALMRTLSFRRCKFKDVEEGFALAEGEGDYDEYRRGHFHQYGLRPHGGDFNDESMVLCERFEIVYPKPPAAKKEEKEA